VAFTEKESVTALVGVPVRLKAVEFAEALAVIPVGRTPETMVHL
jgi:hypothetical protein